MSKPRVCLFYSFPIFTVRPKNNPVTELLQAASAALHLREVLAGGHDVIHKKDIASLKIDGVENKVGELVEAVSAFHLLTVFPYPCGTEAVGDFQAARKELQNRANRAALRSRVAAGMGISTALAAFSL